MQFGASTFIWVSPFSNRTLELMDRAKAMGFDILEICIEDPETIDVPATRAKAAETGIGVTICGAFGPSRNVSSEDAAVRGEGLDYLKRCIDFAEGLGSPSVCGPMYSAVGVTQLLDKPARQAQWDRAAGSLRLAAAYANERGIKLAIEPLNRFETDLINTVDQGLRLVDDIAAPNVGLLLDTFHMNIEEKDIPAAIGRAAGRIVEFHSCSNDRGTPGEDHLPWPRIVEALKAADLQRPGRDRGVHSGNPRDRQGGVDLASAGAKPGRPGDGRTQAPARRVWELNGRTRRGRSPSVAVGRRPTFRPRLADSRGGPCSRTKHSAAGAFCHRHTCRGPPA